jgi:Kyakuja-Dileera-Zisupton transposase
MCPLFVVAYLFSFILIRADVIAALDACYTQKRSKNSNDPDHHDCPRYHPDSVFLSEEDIRVMEEFVATCRSTQPTQRPNRDDEVEDVVEKGMKVPASVLDDCGNSFKAADEKREKASTQFFSDKGLMALLCRHDRVLWIANMTHASERRHYALALIHQLFQHLPPEMTVGILYDIGCQVHRSCLKWGFLGDYLHRIIFGVSVFHAYGHQWPCQIIYHPRKCAGFGLSDGEGCEGFWNAIRKLIPVLRVSGVSCVCVAWFLMAS